MFEFAYPWILCLWPLPWIIRWLLPAHEGSRASALRVPFYYTLTQDNHANARSRMVWWRWIIAVCIWTCLLLAIARPQTLGDPIQQDRAGRNLMLAIDISQSMSLVDLDWQGSQASRLQVVKAVAGEFIDQREGDRLGLILFGSKAYIQTPLTFDRATVKNQLYDATIGLAGKQTAIGDALALGIKHLQDTPEEQRVLILLTDGVSNVGINPQDALGAAIKNKVKIYPIAFGHDNVIVNTILGPQRFDLPLDETMLQNIADASGGQYFRAEDTKALKKVYSELNKLETTTYDQKIYRPVHEWYAIPAGIGLALLCMVMMSRILLLRQVRI